MSSEPAHNLSERSAQRWHEVTDWVSANSLDLVLAALAAIFIGVAPTKRPLLTSLFVSEMPARTGPTTA